MPVFNGDRFLREAVDSVLNQSFRAFEFIIINDGSTDSSAAILDSYQRSDSRIRVHHRSNHGLIDSLNCGCNLASGRYIARMDADDVTVRERFEWQIEFMEEHPEVAVVGGGVEFIDGSGKSLGVMHYPREKAELKSAVLRQNVLQHPAVLMRKDAFVYAGGYRAAFVDAEDYDLWLRIAEKFELANLSPVVIKYRIHQNQVSKRKVRQQTLSALAAQAAALSRRRGIPEVLGSGQEITPEVLIGLGVGEGKQQTALVLQYLRWIGNMRLLGEYGSASGLWREMLRSCSWKHIEKRVAAEAWLTAAPLYWHEGRFLQSLGAAFRAFAARPVVAGRPLKRLLQGAGLL
jgi:hypothetical protein